MSVTCKLLLLVIAELTETPYHVLLTGIEGTCPTKAGHKRHPIIYKSIRQEQALRPSPFLNHSLKFSLYFIIKTSVYAGQVVSTRHYRQSMEPGCLQSVTSELVGTNNGIIFG